MKSKRFLDVLVFWNKKSKKANDVLDIWMPWAQNSEKQMSYESILEAISNFYSIPVKDIVGKSRIKEIANARHIAMYFAYHHMKATLKDIASYFGGRDHTSVLHAVKKIQQVMKDNGDKAHQIYEIETKLV